MRNQIYKFAACALAFAALAFTSCKDDETYADQKKKERDAINAFLGRDVKIKDDTGRTICDVGVINAITEEQFKAQGNVTDLTRNEYVLFASSGVYMQIVREGVGDVMESGDQKRIICRFIEFNILGDSLQLTSEVPYWHTNPDIMDVKNTSGTFSATFNTEINTGGAMYSTYNSTSVPKGWLVPLTYVKVGRQSSEEQIAKVRLIVPHSEGQTNATSAVYPCFYQITFQEMRE